MAQIDHPTRDGSMEVEIVSEASHRGNQMVQVEASEDGVELTDESGDQPWLFAEDVQDDA